MMRLLSPFAFAILFFAPAVCAQTILVLPFDNASSNSRFDWVSEGLALRTRQLLTGESRFVLNNSEWAAAAERIGLPASPEAAGRFTRATMLKLAEELDADFVVFGRFSAANNEVALAAQVLRVSPRRLSSQFTARTPDSDLLPAHAKLAWDLLRFIEPHLSLSQQDFFRRFPPPRLTAFELFARGLMAAEPASRLQLFLNSSRQDPSWPDPAFELGKHFFDHRDCSTSLIWLSRVPPAHPRGLEATFYSGVCHLQLNDPARAESSFSSLRELARLPEALNNLGIARARLGKNAEAASLFRGAAQLDGADADYPFNLALLSYRSGDAASAIAPLREARKQNPEDSGILALLIAALERTGQLAEASSLRQATSRPIPAVTEETLPRMARIKLQIDLTPLHPATTERPSSSLLTTPLQSPRTTRGLP